MISTAFIESLKDKNISLWVDSGVLKYRAPKGALTEDIRGELTKHKRRFIAMLSDKEVSSVETYPLSFNQQSLWFMNQIAPDSACYTVAATCRVVSSADIDALGAACIRLVDRHPVLRSVYVNEPGRSGDRIVQRVDKQIMPDIRVIDASSWAENEVKEKVQGYYALPYDLSQDPVFRLFLFQRAQDDFILMITIHHIACDAYSLKIILDDLKRLYEGEKKDQPVNFDDLPGSYLDFTEWQSHMVESKAGKRHKDYWLKQLAGPLSKLNMPEDFKRPPVPSYNGGSFYFQFDSVAYKTIEAYCQTASVTKYVFFLAVFQVLLKRYGKNDDVLIGTPVLGRSKKEFMRTCGNFINTVVMRGSLKNDQPFGRHLADTKRMVLSSLDHQDYPFSRIVEDLAPDRDSSRSPVFQAMFNLLDPKALGLASMFLHGADAGDTFDFGGLNILPFSIDQEEGQFDLSLEIIDGSDHFSCVLKYNTDVFSEETIAGFVRAYEKYVALALESPDSALADFPVTGSDSDACAICVAATFTAELLDSPLTFWTETLGLKHKVLFAPYNQVFQELLSPSSLFRKNVLGVNVVLIRLEDWWDENNENPVKDLRQKKDEFASALETFASGSNIPVLVCFCPFSKGQQAKTDLDSAESDLITILDGIGNVYPVSSRDILSAVEVEEYDEPLGIEAGHVPYTDEFFASLSYTMARKIYSITGKPYKAIVLDCDQTLWKGVVGEDGPMNVSVDPARKALQELMIEKHHAGTLICLCSKNIEQDVFDVFDHNPEMVLKREHISFSKINWSVKSQNLRELADEINIGLDSFIFIDDNPVECAQVRAECPEVLTLQLPLETEKLKRFVRHTWAFDHLKLTQEDKKRADLYKRERERSTLLKSSLSFEDFIASLGLNISISKPRSDQIPRVSQLTLRTNQFNFTTIRRNESEISELNQSENHACIIAEVTDRFGDYGLVGVMIYEIRESHIEVDTFLLSCRVLGRGVEHALFQYVGKEAQDKGLKGVTVTYRPTKKNQPALNFIESLEGDCQKLEDGTCTYRFTSSYAASVTFSPGSLETGASEEKTARDSGTVQISRASDSESLNHIVENLSDIQGIMEALSHRSPIQPAAGKKSAVVQAGPASKQTEKDVAGVWAKALGFEDIGLDDNFFDLGGKSILMPRIVIQLSKMYAMKISIVDMFQHPTVRMMARHIDQTRQPGQAETRAGQILPTTKGLLFDSDDVAIIGMAGRFPGASDVAEFWKNLLDGVESIRTFTDEELKQWGIPDSLIQNPNYVKRCPELEKSDYFDAGFFSYTPREAEKIDPQQRVFLECAWDVFEDAGYVPDQIEGSVGVFAGCGMNNYMLKNLLAHPQMMESLINFQTFIGNDKDFLSTRVSYKLGLTGPSLSVQTACSTSLVAVQLACLSLKTHQCSMAIAGGVSLQTPRLKGYLYNEGEIFSDDGHCRPFANDATGTVLGEGAGVVLLKRLNDAVRDKDHIYAVIKGAAINNDGFVKIGYTAPSVQGQAEVIALAHDMADVDPETIGYIETHGTGTPLGDPIEVSALTQVFRKKTRKTGYCGIGSIKSNIGHLDVAAGVAGLIKTALIVKHGLIPPSLHVKAVNPELNLSESPFYVNTALTQWDGTLRPRRAGISSFGVGGTNAHILLEEVPEQPPLDSNTLSPWHLLVLSARTPAALEERAARLADFIASHPEMDLGDVAFTLQCGRKAFSYRSVCVVGNLEEAKSFLSLEGASRRISGVSPSQGRSVAFMFTGQGAQYINMAKGLYASQPVFKTHFDRCTEILNPLLSLDILEFLFPQDADRDKNRERLNDTEISQPVLFALEYSLAQLYMHMNILPAAMIGHSLGEYVAACLSGVFSLEDALKLVAQRGKLMQAQPRGDMLAVSLSENDLRPYLDPSLELAVVNAPERCVVSGTAEAIKELKEALNNKGPDNSGRDVPYTLLHTSHAYHSKMMDGAIEPLKEFIEQIQLNTPTIPFISNVTGTWITEKDATDPDYWARHLRQTIRFSEGIQALLSASYALIEVGPGQVLSTLARQNITEKDNSCPIISTLRHPQSKDDDEAFFLNSIGRMWVSGIDVNWRMLQGNEGRGRTPLPGYPFERQRFWIKPTASYLPLGEQTVPMDMAHEEPDSRYRMDKDETSLYARPSTVTTDYQQPADDLEVKLAGIWQNVLGIQGIGVHDNYFELGGDSLIAAQIISRIRDQWSCHLPIRTLFEFPTIHELADQLRQKGLAENKKGEEVIVPLAEGDVPELSLAQQRLWFINQLDPHSPAYNIVQAVRLVGDLKENMLKKSLDEILRRHDSLRAIFKKVSGKPIVVIREDPGVDIKTVVVAHDEEGQGELEARKYIAEQSPILFDLERGPLLRAYLFQIGTSEYIFAMVMHHIVADGWSMGVWMDELSKLYHAHIKGEPSPLPELPIQYADFSRWQKIWLAENSLKGQEDYWMDQLQGELPVIQLATDYPRPAAPKYTGRHQSIVFPAGLSRSIKDLAKKENTTVYVVLLAAYFVLLRKYSNQNDIVVGTPYANRDRLDIENLIGFFINMLPIRVSMGADICTRDLIRKVHDQVVGALSHKDLPFEQLVDLLHPERTMSYQPVFQVMFAFQNFPLPIDPDAELLFEPIVMDRGATEFELSLYMWEEKEQICGVFEYSDEIFETATIEHMVGHFENLLTAMTAQPQDPVKNIGILTESEKKRILHEWNDNTIDFPKDKCIHDLFDAQTKAVPDATAIICNEHRVTYKELNNRANLMAADLIQMGIKPDDLVGICVGRSIPMIVAMFAVLKAGGAYVPLDPDYPVERVKFMLSDSKSRVVITQTEFKPLFSESDAALILVDDILNTPIKADVPTPETDVRSTNLAYVIYTSGSTGLPKGVAIEHQSPIALFAWAQTVFTDHELGGMLASTSICFDLSVFEIFLPLITGGKIIIADNALALSTLPARSEVHLINTVPSAINELSKSGSIPPSVTTINLAGEPLKQELVDRLYDVKTVQRVYDLYGPSEDTTYSTWTLRKKNGRSTIGRPIANSSCYLVDQYQSPVPVGVPGEIYIGGAGLARGYLHRPELTNEKFIPDFMSKKPGERLYRTGDLARYYPDGNICYIGRIDHQIKLRGFRIELGEIEASFTKHAHVHQCVAMVREDTPGDQRLVAYIVPTTEYHEQDSGLRNHLRTTLPDYMIPQHIVTLPEFPMTSNGKIDRKQLPPPVVRLKAADLPISEKMTELEERLLEIWKAVLELEYIGINDNFFEIGGHSLLSVRIFSEIYNLTGINLPLAVMFKSPTIHQLSKEIESSGGRIKTFKKVKHNLESLFSLSAKQEKSQKSQWSHLVPIQPKGNRTPVFCMHAVGGNVLNYYPFAKAFGEDQPLYGLQARGLDGISEPYQTIEEMAENYIREMLMIQPIGPYYVLGASMGGFIALEVAQQLKKMGHEISFLAMLDTFSPTYFLESGEKENFKSFFFRHFSAAIHLPFNEKIKYVKNRLKSTLKTRFNFLKCTLYKRLNRPLPHSLRYWYVEQKHWIPIMKYSPPMYDGDLILFSEALLNRTSDRDLKKGWDDYISGEIKVIQIFSKHNEFVEDPMVAVKLSECINNVHG